MKNSRRKFLKIAGAIGLGLGSGAGLKAFASSESLKSNDPVEDVEASSTDTGDLSIGSTNEVGGTYPDKAVETPKYLPLTATQWGMIIDTRKFKTSQDLMPVIEACQKIHNIPRHTSKKHEIKWIWEEEYFHAFPTQVNKYLSEEIGHRSFPVLCNHCENPPCVKACPTKATFKRQDGVVMMDYHRCIGCRFCMAGCPYGARSFNYIDPRQAIKDRDFNPEFPTRMKGVVEKCNFCAERIATGKFPACVEASRGAILFGDLNDPSSKIREVLKSHYTIRRKPGLGTEPAVYYII